MPELTRRRYPESRDECWTRTVKSILTRKF